MPGTRTAAASPSTWTAGGWTPACWPCRCVASSTPATLAWSPPPGRSASGSTRAAACCTATCRRRRPTGCPAMRARSYCAASGWSTTSPSRAGLMTPWRCMRSCAAAPARWVCCRSRSTRPPHRGAGCGSGGALTPGGTPRPVAGCRCPARTDRRIGHRPAWFPSRRAGTVTIVGMRNRRVHPSTRAGAPRARPSRCGPGWAQRCARPGQDHDSRFAATSGGEERAPCWSRRAGCQVRPRLTPTGGWCVSWSRLPCWGWASCWLCRRRQRPGPDRPGLPGRRPDHPAGRRIARRGRPHRRARRPRRPAGGAGHPGRAGRLDARDHPDLPERTRPRGGVRDPLGRACRLGRGDHHLLRPPGRHGAGHHDRRGHPGGPARR